MSLAVRRPSLLAEPAWETIPLRAGSRTHRLLAGSLLVGSLALAFMLGCAWLVDITEVKIHGLADSLNDQVGYVTVARNLRGPASCTAP